MNFWYKLTLTAFDADTFSIPLVKSSARICRTARRAIPEPCTEDEKQIP